MHGFNEGSKGDSAGVNSPQYTPCTVLTASRVVQHKCVHVEHSETKEQNRISQTQIVLEKLKIIKITCGYESTLKLTRDSAENKETVHCVERSYILVSEAKNKKL